MSERVCYFLKDTFPALHPMHLLPTSVEGQVLLLCVSVEGLVHLLYDDWFLNYVFSLTDGVLHESRDSNYDM